MTMDQFRAVGNWLLSDMTAEIVEDKDTGEVVVRYDPGIGVAEMRVPRETRKPLEGVVLK